MVERARPLKRGPHAQQSLGQVDHVIPRNDERKNENRQQKKRDESRKHDRHTAPAHQKSLTTGRTSAARADRSIHLGSARCRLVGFHGITRMSHAYPQAHRSTCCRADAAANVQRRIRIVHARPPAMSIA